MESLGTIREFETPHFRVIVDAIEENDVDLSFDESGDTAQKLENGDLMIFCARARVLFKATGEELASDYLGQCIYKNLEDFQDHRECAGHTRKLIRQNGRFQIYRKSRPYEHCLTASDKLKKRGFATRQRAEAWAKINATEPYDIFESGVCGSYFADMISQSIKEARKSFADLRNSIAEIRLREAS